MNQYFLHTRISNILVYFIKNQNLFYGDKYIYARNELEIFIYKKWKQWNSDNQK